MNACEYLTRMSNAMRFLGSLGLAVSIVAFHPYGSTRSQDSPTAPPLSRHEGPSRIDFNRQIRPILSDHCFHCHGPDAAHREADLRLDDASSAKAARDGKAAVVPGDSSISELIARITAQDPAERMPPPDSGRDLNPTQIELLKRWVDEGADWSTHWAFQTPIRRTVPSVVKADRTRNAIDGFVQSRLEAAGFELAPEASRTTLLRRATLDLTGLPPTPEEIDAFLADNSPDAYERAVDRLLASPRFGERMAVRWLDGARYADTSGYQTDGERTMWRWRDWVIDAFNQDLPFDQFTIEQLAGDLLPDSTLDQRIATGFHRNHRGNSEGGIIPEEFAVEYVADRVETTFTVWMGLTMGCARCHDHKFDPLSQREFYEAFAYFNNVPEYGRALKFGNSPPFLRTPTRDQQRRIAELEQQLNAARAIVVSKQDEVSKAQSAWEATFEADSLNDWTPTTGQIWPPVAESETPTTWIDVSRIEGGPIERVPSRMGAAVSLNGNQFLDAGDIGNFGFYDKFTLSAWIFPKGNLSGTIISRMEDVPEGEGYSLTLKDGKIQVNLVKRWLDDAVRVETESTLSSDQWHHVAVVYDGSRVADGIKIYVNGIQVAARTNVDLLNQNFATASPLRIGGGHGPNGRFNGRIGGVRVSNQALNANTCLILSAASSIPEIIENPSSDRSAAESAKLQACFLATAAPAGLRQVHSRVVELEQTLIELIESCPTTMVMAEMPEPRTTHILVRGEYNKPGERVASGTPRCLPQISADYPKNRLGFARWLVQPAHPLTARVAVNRFWQMLFGTGLVKTVDDFGAQGEPPPHQELLDWLAVEFAAPRTPPGQSPVPTDQGDAESWRIKRLLRLMVTSATYRQSSHASPEMLQLDPENRLLARGPRLRLSAEMVRDQALYSSGLLVETLGGPSVKPYQPTGLWKELGDSEYQQDHGPGLYRRSMYTFWKRTVPPPTLLTFDAANRETCIVRESRTNTPLQALILMNDVTYIEAARAMAWRVMHETPGSLEDRLDAAFRITTSRKPLVRELAILRDAWHAQRERFQKDVSVTRQFLAQGESVRNAELDPCEWAAYTTICNLLLNLDEVITKE